jgi:hypothetical protein
MRGWAFDAFFGPHCELSMPILPLHAPQGQTNRLVFAAEALDGVRWHAYDLAVEGIRLLRLFRAVSFPESGPVDWMTSSRAWRP